MAVGQVEQGAPLRQVHYLAGGVPGRAGIDELRARQHVRRHARVIDCESVFRQGVDIVWSRAREQGRALVDLVERVGADDHRVTAAAINHDLGQRKQGLARAVHRKHLG